MTVFATTPPLTDASVLAIVKAYGSPEKCAQYIVTVDPDFGVSKAVNGHTGTTELGGILDAGGISGSDTAAVIQAAFLMLTPGRTWKEKVVFKGNSTLARSLFIPSYTVFEIQGKLTLENDVNQDMLVLQNFRYIDVIGGFLDGNKAGNTSGRGIYLNNSTYLGDVISSIQNVFINNVAYRGIEAEGWVNGTTIEDVNIYGSGECGFWINSGDMMLSNCVAGQNGRAGFYIGAVVGYQLMNCKSFGNGRNATYVEGDGFFISGSSSLFVNCYGQDNRRHGFVIFSTQPATYGRFNVLIGCAGEGNSFDSPSAIGFGIRIDSVTDNKIIGFSAIDRHYGTSPDVRTQVGGIWLAGTAMRNTIIGCDVTTNISYTVTIDVGATGNKIRDVNGFVTENYGSAVGTGVVQSIAHGCNFIPTLDQVFLSERSTGGALPRQWIVGGVTYIYVSAGTGMDFNWRVSMN